MEETVGNGLESFLAGRFDPQTVASSPAKAGLAADIDKTNITVATDLAIRHCIARPD